MFYKEQEISYPVSFISKAIPLGFMTDSSVPFSVADLVTSNTKNTLSKAYLSVSVPTANASASIPVAGKWVVFGT